MGEVAREPGASAPDVDALQARATQLPEAPRVDAQLHRKAADEAHGNATRRLRELLRGRPAQRVRRQAALRAASRAVDHFAEAFDATSIASLKTLATRLHRRGVPEAGDLCDRLDLATERRVLDEVKVSSPNPAKIDALIGDTPDPAKVRRMLATMYPGLGGHGHTPTSAKLALQADLAAGGVGDRLLGVMGRSGMASDVVDGFVGMMAEVRSAFAAGSQASSIDAPDADMQRSNWVHTRVEVMKAALAYERIADPPDPDELLAVLMGSLCSDAFKDASAHSLLWHNRPGAELVLPLLAERHLPDTPKMKGAMLTAMKLAHEHQITPAMFMSGAMNGLLTSRGIDDDIKREIVDKIADPLGAPRTGNAIDFSDAACAALDDAGIPGWATMDPDSAHFALSQVVAYADVQQYAAYDGIIKIACDIRSPDHALPFMRDPNIRAAVDSCVGFSFAKGMEAIQHEGLVAEGAGQVDVMRSALSSKVYPEVERRLKAALGLPRDAAMPDVPYWNLDVPTDGTLLEDEAKSAGLVRNTLRDVLAEMGAVPVDPFGGQS